LPFAQVFVREIRLTGNAAISAQELASVTAPYVNRDLTSEDLEALRLALTHYYINKGYINSGAIIPDQSVANGVVAFRFVEGRVNDVEVSGTEHFDPEYFRSRLARGTEPPFNVERLGREQQILLQSPLVRRLNLELLPGLEPGEARLHADVLEANRFSLNAQIADDQSPTVGAVRGQLQGFAANLLGFGDILTAQYGRSQGLNDGYVGYSVPIASDDTRVSVRYDRNGVVVVTPDLSPLNVTSSFSSIGVGLSRPIYRTPEQALTVGASLERRQQQIRPPKRQRQPVAVSQAETLPDAAVETTIPAPLPLPSAAAWTKAPLVRATRFSPRKASTPPGSEP